MAKYILNVIFFVKMLKKININCRKKVVNLLIMSVILHYD